MRNSVSSWTTRRSWPMPPPVIDVTPGEARALLLRARAIQARRSSQRAIYDLFPATGPLRRDLYAKHLEYFAAGAEHRERCFLSANRVGKTLAGCYEDALHLTGRYDQIAPWWQGKRFPGPIKAWVWAYSDEKVKETVQEVLFGPVGAWGSGLIPGETILKIDRATGPIK